MNRRELLMGALATAVASCHVFAKTDAGSVVFSPGAESVDNSRNLAFLTVFSDILIPRTDTPGASDAGVPGIIMALINDWAGVDVRTQMLIDIDLINERLSGQGEAFLAQGLSQQTDALEELDTFAFSASEMSASLKAKDVGAKDVGRAYRSFKRLVVLAFFMSEDGATKTLRYDAIPGKWDGCAPVKDDERAWASEYWAT